MSKQLQHCKKIIKAKEIGDLLRQIRKSDGFRIEDASDLAGFGNRFISEVERGKPTASLGKVLKISAAYGLKFFINPHSSISIKRPYGHVSTTKDIGQLLRHHRKEQGATLKDVIETGALNLRFLSDFENGRENIRLEKALLALSEYGLDLFAQGSGKEHSND